jgi:tetratricopeptide (TPR) repeat protein
MNDIQQQPPSAQSSHVTHMQADARGRARVYQAGQSIVIHNYGDDDVRQAAVVVPLSAAAAESQAAVFLGRDQEIASLLNLLEPPPAASANTIVSVISGLAGVGKTALVRHTASLALARGWFTAAVFTDLRGYDPDPQVRVAPEQLFSSMLRAFGVSAVEIPTSSSEQATSYHQLLASMASRGHRVLLVLDNVSGPTQVSGLLPDAPIHRVLITSRHTLGELDNIGLLELDTLSESEAVAVLMEVARQRGPGDVRISRDRQKAEELVRLCGCLPLALRITGALLAEDPDLPLADFVGDLTDTKTRLEGLVYGERAVSAAFDLSWQHLLERDEQAAKLFVWLPINPGPEISSEAAAALIGRSRQLTRRWLRVLRRGHLIEPGTSSGRWRMHDLLRLYAGGLGRLGPSDDYSAAVDRLLRYYLAATDAAKNQVFDFPQQGSRLFTDGEEALTWLDIERPNLTGTVLLAAEAGYQDLAVDLSLALSALLRLRRHFDDYVVTATAGARAAGLLDDPRRHAAAVSNLGLAPQEARLADEILASHQRDLTRCREAGDRSGEAWALVNLGTVLWTMGRYHDAIDIAQRTSKIFGELGDSLHEAWSLTMLGLALQKAGWTDRSIEAHEQACAIFRQAADQNGEAWSLNNLGDSLRAAKRFDEAIEVGQRASAIFREVGDRSGEGATLVNLGVALRGLRKFDEAVQALQQACKVFQEAGDRQREAGALGNVGITLRDMGRLDESIKAHEQARVIFRGIGDKHGEASSLTELGVALREARLASEARRHWTDAIEVFQEIGASDDAERARKLVAESEDDRRSLD